MQDFMMPAQPGVAGELPPWIPQQPVGVAPAPVAQAASPAPLAIAPARDYQQLLMDEGATGDTPGGMGFFDKIRSDPKMAQAMLMAGTRMMQGNKAGQDDLGMLGEAMMAGATAHNMLSYNEKQNALKQQELDMKQRESVARLGQLEQETKFKAELQPMEVEKARELIAKYKTENKSAEAKALGDAIRNDPEMVRRTLDDQHNVSRANVNQSNSASASSGALAAERKQELAWKRIVADPKATEEQKQAAREGLQAGQVSGRGSSVSAGVQNRADLYKYYEGMNPGMSVAELNQKVLNHETTAKRRDVGVELSDFAYKHGFDITKAEGLAEARKTFDQVFGTTNAGNAADTGARVMPPVESRVAGKTTFVNPNGVMLVWDGSKWSPK